MSTIAAAPVAAATPRQPGRRLAALQISLAAAYVAAVAAALGRAATLSGFLYLPHQGDVYTGNADIWPGAMYGVWWALILIIGVAPLGALVLTIVGMVRLSMTRVRKDAAIWRRLLTGTVLSVLVVVVWLTPAARTLLVWLMD
jgi:hypothetical protein